MNWQQFRYHPVQAKYWEYNGRFAAVVAGRRSGKTELARRKLILSAAIRKPWPNPIYVYLLPTYQQAKRVAWYPILNMVPKDWLYKGSVNISELTIRTVFGSQIIVAGADKPERLEGIPCDGCVIDESADQRPELFTRTVVPMLTDRNGFCHRIGVPKRTGVGRVTFREFFEKGQRGESNIASFYWKSSEILTTEQLAEAKELLDPLDYAEQFDAEWLDAISTVYYNYTNATLLYEAVYDPTQEIIVGCDFNVSPMSWILAHFIDGKLYVFDEMAEVNTNTPAMLDKLFNRYYEHNAGWKFFGDASSRSRRTSASRSDYLIIKEDARFGNKKVYFPEKNPMVRDRIAAVNRAFLRANGNRTCFINPKCKRLINDLLTVNYEEGTSEIEDYSGTSIGHMADALGYAVMMVLPLRVTSGAVPAVWSNAG